MEIESFADRIDKNNRQLRNCLFTQFGCVIVLLVFQIIISVFDASLPFTRNQVYFFLLVNPGLILLVPSLFKRRVNRLHAERELIFEELFQNES